MKTRRKPARRSALQFENLESRFALAGLVTVTPGAKGALSITGDSAANDITITLVNNQWHIAANGDTQVRLGGKVPGPAGASLDVAVPTGKVDILTGFADTDSDAIDKKHASGNETADVVKFDGSVNHITVAGPLTITGKNAGIVELDGTTVSGKTTITFGDGFSSPNVGSVVSIFGESSLGLPNSVNKNKPQAVSITTGTAKGVTRDSISITDDTQIGGKLSIDTKGAKESGVAPATDEVVLIDLNVGGDLAIKGMNGGVLDLHNVEAKGTTTITYGEGNSAVGIGSTITIADTKLGVVSPKGKNTTITTGISSDRVLITDTQFGGIVAINVKDGNNNVAVLGTRGGPTLDFDLFDLSTLESSTFESSSTVGGNLTITTGSGDDRVGVLGLVVKGNLGVATGKGNDFSGAADMAVVGTTSVTSLDGDDVAAIGLRDELGNPLPANGKGNILIGNVKVDMGKGNDTVAAHKTIFGGFKNSKLVPSKITVTLGDGDDMLAESENRYLGASDQFTNAFNAIKASKGGKGFDTILSDLEPTAQQMFFLQFESDDLGQLPVIIDKIFHEVDLGFRDILAEYGINIGGGGGGGDDHGNILAEATPLGDLPVLNKPGILEDATDVDMFSFTLDSAQDINILLRGIDENFDGVIRVFDQFGFDMVLPVDETHGELSEESVVFLALPAGTYFVGVSGSGNSIYSGIDGSGLLNGATGEYTLDVSGIPEDINDQISEVQGFLILPIQDPNNPPFILNGEIENRFGVDLWEIEMAISQSITIFVTVSPETSLFLRIFDDQGNELHTAFAADPLDGSITLVFDALTEGFPDGSVFYAGVSAFGNNAYDPNSGGGDTEGDSTGGYAIVCLAN